MLNVFQFYCNSKWKEHFFLIAFQWWMSSMNPPGWKIKSCFADRHSHKIGNGCKTFKCIINEQHNFSAADAFSSLHRFNSFSSMVFVNDLHIICNGLHIICNVEYWIYWWILNTRSSHNYSTPMDNGLIFDSSELMTYNNYEHTFPDNEQ